MKDGKRKKLFSSIVKGNLLTLVIPVLLLAVLINTVLYNYFNKDIYNKDNVIAANIQSNIEYFLNDAIDTLEYVDIILENQEVSNMNTEIDKANSINNYFENIEVIDENGKVIYTLSSNLDQINHDRSGEEYFKSIKKNPQTYWSRPFISPVSGILTVTVAMPKEQKIIVGYLSLDYISQYTEMSTPDLGKGITVSILDNYGVYISDNDMRLVAQRQLDPNFELFRKLSNQNENHTHIEYNGSESMAVVKQIEQPDWYLVIFDDFEHSFQLINRLLKLFVFLFFVSIIVFVVLSSVRAYRISNYIHEFINKTEAISSGNFEVDFEEQRYEEFSKLADHFKLMTKKLKIRDSELENLAYHDNLTGLRNRAYLYERLWINGKFKTADLIGLIYLDVDNFKNVNDLYGHNVGDSLLVQLSNQLLVCVDDEYSVLSRLGGDEFVILIADHYDHRHIKETIRKIRQQLREPLILEERSIFITISMGISTVNNGQVYDFVTQLRYADTAMYVAKEQGKNRFQFFNPSMNERIKKRMTIEQNLITALENNEFSLVYQPQIFTGNAEIRGFEALLRWKNADLAGIGPGEFIAVAEENGIIVQIGEWVAKQACETIKAVNEMFRSNYVMAINVSPAELRNVRYYNTLIDIIAETGIKPEWLEIEITENVFVDNPKEIIKTLNLLSKEGVNISLDDFGTGYSSLSYLNKLPINTLKIDREFIMELENEKASRNLVESITLIARKLGIFVVAEGAENEEQVKILDKLLCDSIQGYYFSKPLSYQGVTEYIALKKQLAICTISQFSPL